MVPVVAVVVVGGKSLYFLISGRECVCYIAYDIYIIVAGRSVDGIKVAVEKADYSEMGYAREADRSFR